MRNGCTPSLLPEALYTAANNPIEVGQTVWANAGEVFGDGVSLLAVWHAKVSRVTSRGKIHVTYEADGAKGEHIPGHIFTKEVPGMAILMKDVVVDTEDAPSDDAAGSDATIDDDDDNNNTKGGAADGPAKKKVLKGRRKPTLTEYKQKEVAVRIQAGDPEAVALLDTMNGTALRGVVQHLGVAIKHT